MSEQSNSNTFRSLFQIDVNRYVEKKGQFSYLSWPFAVAQLRLADPSASWEVRRFDGLPYLSSELGFFVEVAVTVQGVTLSQIHPVLDNKNRPIMAPSPFDINTSIQRCLVKAIALHGLGLSIYAGEDLPDLPESEGRESDRPREATSTKAKQAKVTNLPSRTKEPLDTSGEATGDRLTEAQLRYIKKLIAETETDTEQLLTYFGYGALEAIPKAEVNRVIKALEAKRRAA